MIESHGLYLSRSVVKTNFLGIFSAEIINHSETFRALYLTFKEYNFFRFKIFTANVAIEASCYRSCKSVEILTPQILSENSNIFLVFANLYL